MAKRTLSNQGKGSKNRIVPFPTGFREILAIHVDNAKAKKQGIDDALLQPYSGHESRQSLEIYSKLSLGDAQPIYDSKIKDFPV